MSNPKRNQSRWSEETFFKTTAFSKVVDAINTSISFEGKLISRDERIIRLTAFAICKGGLGRSQLLINLVNKIIADELVIQISAVAPFIEFEPTNEEAGNEGFYRWFIDAESLSAIHAFSRIDRKRRVKPINEKWLFKLLKQRFRSIPEFEHIKNLKSFCEAGAMYVADHPDTNIPAYQVAFMLGQTKTTSVSSACWKSLLNNSNKEALDPGPELTVETEARKEDLACKTSPSNDDSTFLSKLRTALQDKDADGRVIPVSLTLSKLERLNTNDMSLQQIVLLEFFVYGLRVRSWMRSTAGTYLSHIGKHWFSFTKDKNYSEFDEFAMTELFEAMLDATQGNISQAEKVITLKHLFSFATENFGVAPAVVDHISVQKVSNIRNYVISEPDFMRFINSMSTVQENQTLTGQGLVLTAILMARCGLRPTEVLKLRLKDVEPSNQRCIFIRQNRFGANKSHSARRKIPLSLMLLPNELALFESYIKQRSIDVNGQLKSLLFSSSANAHTPYSLSDFYNKFSARLTEICGEKVHTYHLRHKALSVLQVTLLSERLAHISPYHQKQSAKIRKYFGIGQGRDALYELAAFAGHLSPETTFKNYLHFTDVLLHEQLTATVRQKHRRFWENLSGLSKAIMTRRCSSANPIHAEVQTLLVESLCKEKRSLKATENSAEQKQDFTPPRRKVTFSECMTALRLLDSQATITEIADTLDIEDEIVDGWYTRAILAAELKTSKGVSRLFPNKESDGQHRITPVPPSSNVEQQRAEQAIESARALYKSHRLELSWFVSRVINTAMNSHSYLQFHDINELDRFMKFALRMTRIYEWRLEIELPETDRAMASSMWQKVHEDLDVGVRQKRVRSKKFKHGRAYLYFLHPRKPSSDNERYSSNIVKYVCHILAIMISGVITTNTELASEA